MFVSISTYLVYEDAYSATIQKATFQTVDIQQKLENVQLRQGATVFWRRLVYTWEGKGRTPLLLALVI